MLESRIQNIKEHQRHILLSIANMQEEQAFNLCHKLKSCYQLESISIDLADSRLDKQGLSYLSTGLEGHSKLQQLKLDLSDNILNSEDWFPLGRALGSYSKLKQIELSFWRCNLDISGLKNIFNVSTVDQHVYLVNEVEELTLDFQYNTIGEDGSIVIQQVLESSKEVKSINIYLWNNSLGNYGAQRVGRGIGMLSKLKTLSLNLSDNKITREGCELLFQALVLAKSIEDLTIDLSNNKIMTKGCIYIGDNLTQLILLNSLYLNIRQNSIGEGGFIYLVDKLKCLVYLMSLSIDAQQNPDITKQQLIDSYEIMKKEYQCIHAVTLLTDGQCLEEQINSYYEQNEQIGETEIAEMEKMVERKLRREANEARLQRFSKTENN